MERESCILRTIDDEGKNSCFVKDCEISCPFATDKGMEKYRCKSGIRKPHTPYQFKLNNIPVDDWVNERLNANIPKEWCKLYDDCINGLEKIFTPYNNAKCVNCVAPQWAEYRDKENRHDCGCCVHCASDNAYAYYLERDLLINIPIPFDKQGYREGWGYFNPDIHSCKLPRHLRSSTCLNYFCGSSLQDVKDPLTMAGKVNRLMYVIRCLREDMTMDKYKIGEAKKILQKLDMPVME